MVDKKGTEQTMVSVLLCNMGLNRNIVECKSDDFMKSKEAMAV